MKRLIKKSCILCCMFLGTVFFSCSNGTNPDSSLPTAQDENTDTPGHDTPEQPQTVDLSELISSLSDDEIAVLVESVNTQILSTENGVSGITLSLDGDKNLVLNYADEAEIKLTPPLTEDGAIKLLEAYADKNTVINAKKTELKNTADSMSLSSVIKTPVKTMIENIPAEKFAYDFGNRAIYLKMSDLDSESLPVATEDGATVIPGVKRIKKNDRTALDFTELANANIKIDFDKNVGSDKNYVSFYRGGFKFAQDSTIELINTQNKSLYEEVFTGDFKKESGEKEIRSIFHELAKLSNTNLPTLDLDTKRIPGNTEDSGNLYGTGLDKILEKYYDLDKVEMYLSAQKLFDAKEVLNGTSSKRMFDDSGNLNSDISLNESLKEKISIPPELASYLIKNGVDLKNVIIKEGTWTHIEESSGLGTIVNSVVDADMSGEDEAYVKGLVRFNNKSPKNLVANGKGSYSKVIFGSANAWNDGIEFKLTQPVFDVSKLDAKQDDIYKKIYRGYYSGDKSFTRSLQASMMFGTKYYKSTNEDYSDLLRETYGNTNVEPKDTDLIQRIKLKDDAQVPLSRANNIKLTPIQKLLLDDQHIYG